MVTAAVVEGAGAAAEAAGVTDGYRPATLTLQWHITEACNLACSHCYQDPRRQAASLTELSDVLTQFRGLLHHFRQQAPHATQRAHINLTGGEPFCHPQIFQLLQKVAAGHAEFSFALLSNGSYLDREATQRLAKLKPRFVQLSIEGNAATHDAIRGPGDHERVCRAATNLRAAGVPVLLSFTAQRGNYRDFPEVARLGRRLGVKRVWADRFIPIGGVAENLEKVLTPGETRDLFELMKRAQRHWNPFARTEIAMHRALQFLIGDGKPYRCQAGRELITIMANGDLVPCRRMPLVAGNLHRTSLHEIYLESPLLKQLRAPLPEEHPCQPCTYSGTCGGGLRCLGHALSGHLQQRDPGCWKEPVKGV